MKTVTLFLLSACLAAVAFAVYPSTYDMSGGYGYGGSAMSYGYGGSGGGFGGGFGGGGGGGFFEMIFGRKLCIYLFN